MEKRLEYVKKRDGRTAPFDRRKIADAIFKAAQSVGGQDRYLADDLAEVVKMYLAREYKGDVPSVEDIQDVVERILIKTGHAKTAKAYILYRQKRARARKIREGYSPEDLSEREQERVKSGMEVNLPVRRSDDNVSLWDKDKIVAALVRETALPENIAELIVLEVEEEIIASKVSRLSSTLIRELVNAKLVQYGFEEERRRHARLGLPFYDVKTFFEEFRGLPDELSMGFGRAVKREFAMNAVLPDEAVEKHLRGEIILRNREGIDRCLSVNIPVPEVNAGEFSAEVSRLLRVLEPFTENNLVLRLPGNVPPAAVEKTVFSPSRPVGVERAFNSIIEEILLDAGQRKVPVSFRIEDGREMGVFASMTEKTGFGGKLSVYRGDGCRGVLVLNRIVFNLSIMEFYAEQQGLSPGDYANAIIPMCSETMKRQLAFLSGNYAGNAFLEKFPGAESTLEVECPAFPEGADIIRGGFIESLLDNGLSFVTDIPGDAEERSGFFLFLRSLMEKDRSGRQKIVVRVTNV